MKTLNKISLFWDVQSADPVKNSSFVIDRILNYGEEEDFKWAAQYYGIDRIKAHLEEKNNLDNKSLSFWCKYFNVDPIKCIQKQSITRQGLFWKR